MQQLGRLVEEHVSWVHLYRVFLVIVVEDDEGPGFEGLLVHIDDYTVAVVE